MPVPLRQYDASLDLAGQGTSPQSLLVDFTHPLSRGLVVAVPFWNRELRNYAVPGLFPYGNITNTYTPELIGIANSGVTEDVTPFGPGLKFTGVQSDKVELTSTQAIDSNSYTILAICNPAASGSAQDTPFSQRIQAGAQVDMIMNSNNANGQVSGIWAMFNNGTTLSSHTIAGTVDGNYHVFVGRVSNGTSTCWQDGVNVTQTGGSGVLASNVWNASQSFSIGSLANFTGSNLYACRCTIALILVWNNRALEDNEIASICNDPWQVFYPVGGDLPALFQPSGGPVSGTLAATEATDTASFAGSVVVSGTLAATETPDTAAFAGFVGVSGTLAATELADTAAFAGSVVVSGTLAATEAKDTAAFVGSVVVSGTLAATEATDTAAFAGSVVVSGSLASTEAKDTAAFAGTVVSGIGAVLAATESPDTASFAGQAVISAALAATEAKDTAAFAGTIAAGISGALAATESPDTATFTGAVFDILFGTLVASETPDSAAFAGFPVQPQLFATLSATERRDTALFLGEIKADVGVLNFGYPAIIVPRRL